MADLVHEVMKKKFGKSKLPSFKSGDTVTVSLRIREGEKERIQLFSGVVTRIRGSGMGQTFTVRKISDGVGVEKTLPIMSPAVAGVEVLAKGKARRARLFYLRNLSGKAANITSELATASDNVVAGAPAPEKAQKKSKESSAKK